MVFREIIAKKIVRRRSIDRDPINIITIFSLDQERSGRYARIGPRRIANPAIAEQRIDPCQPQILVAAREEAVIQFPSVRLSAKSLKSSKSNVAVDQWLAALEAVYPGKADEVELIDFFGRDEALAHLCFVCAEMRSARTPGKSKRVDCRSDRYRRPRRLPCIQARSDRANEERRARICLQRNSLTTGKRAQNWRTVSSDLAKANEKHNQVGKLTC